MVALTEPVRLQTRDEFMREHDFPGDCIKSVLKAAIDATDNWIEANFASYNAALPQPFRGSATLKQKLRLFKKVLNAKFGN